MFFISVCVCCLHFVSTLLQALSPPGLNTVSLGQCCATRGHAVGSSPDLAAHCCCSVTLQHLLHLVSQKLCFSHFLHNSLATPFLVSFAYSFTCPDFLELASARAKSSDIFFLFALLKTDDVCSAELPALLYLEPSQSHEMSAAELLICLSSLSS